MTLVQSFHRCEACPPSTGAARRCIQCDGYGYQFYSLRSGDLCINSNDLRQVPLIYLCQASQFNRIAGQPPAKRLQPWEKDECVLWDSEATCIHFAPCYSLRLLMHAKD